MSSTRRSRGWLQSTRKCPGWISVATSCSHLPDGCAYCRYRSVVGPISAPWSVSRRGGGATHVRWRKCVSSVCFRSRARPAARHEPLRAPVHGELVATPERRSACDDGSESVWQRPPETPGANLGRCSMQVTHGMRMHTRSGGSEVESRFEKPVILPDGKDADPARHAWADARFATDIMAEHAVFFALLMPPEVAGEERQEALRFAADFAALHQRIDGSETPDRSGLQRFTSEVVEAMKPFIAYKATLGEAQRDGTLRSLVWPLFF